MKNSILFLAGSGEFTSSMLDIDRNLCEHINGQVKVGIVPLAAGKERGYRKWIDDGISHFKNLGIDSVGFDIKSREGCIDSRNIDLLEDINFLYFSGGDPKYLFESLKDTPFWLKILDKFNNGNFILAGSSAGAMVMGKAIPKSLNMAFPGSRGNEDLWEESFGLVNFPIIPHFDRFSRFLDINYFKHRFFKSFGNNNMVLGIDEDTGVKTSDSKTFQVLGKGRVVILYKDRDAIEYRSSNKFSINDKI